MNAKQEAREPVARYLATPPLLQHFERVASAPGGVARLRELILTLAVQGKLIPQDPADEPASLLLERIRDEKARLVKAGTIRKEKPLAAIAEKEKPFALPAGWEFVRLPQATFNWGQTTPFEPFTYIDVAAIDNERGRITDAVQVIEATDAPSRARKIVRQGTVIYSTVRPYLKNIATVESNYLPSAIASTAFAVMHPHNGLISQYLLIYLRSQPFTDFVSSKMVGVAYPAINDANFFQGVLPLPPTSEQSRIVTRVEELMALCDALEEKGQLAAAQHERLAGTLFDALASSASAEEAADHWQRIAAHFDLLLDRPAAVDRLEQTILQLAVRGRLVPQNPADEPASALLQKIRAEKDRLIATGQLKRDKPLPPISDEEKPFELPEGWEWARFGNLILSSDAGWSPSCESIPRESNEWGVLKVSAVSWGEFRPEENKALPVGLSPKPEFEVKPGDFLLSRANTEELVARSVVAWEPPERLMMSDKLIRLRLSSHIDKALYCEINNSRLSRDHFIVNASGTSSSMKNVSREVVLKLVVPVPPAPEQSRIVARVVELRALCAQLRDRLATTARTRSRLAEALLEQAVA